MFNRFLKRLRDIVASSTLFYVTLGLIIVSCLFFAASISYRIPSDEFFHFRFIEFYAQQPVQQGPFITDQGSDFFDLRDITRTPSYLYHYVLSFGLRGLQAVTDSLFVQVFVLRVVTLAMGIASLFVVRRILRQIKASAFAQNAVLFLLGLTGMLLWIFASINYDVPAVLLYLLCVSVGLSILQGKGISTRRLAMFVTLAMLCVLTKVTFMPFLALLVVGVTVLKRRDLHLYQDLRWRWKHIILGMVLVVTSLLFIERIGLNVIRYQQIEVSCNKVHAYSDCMKDDVFSRNENQLEAYAQAKANGYAVHYQPYQFTQNWLTLMYERIHFYFGHQQMLANHGAKVFAALVGLAFLILVALFWRRLATSPGERLLLFITLSYGLVMYVFNLQTYLTYGQPYAFQGRYLLPVMPFFYYFCVKLLLLGYHALRGRMQQLFATAILVVATFSIYTHLPLLVFYRGTQSHWWPEPLQDFNHSVQDTLGKINIKPLP